MMTKEYRAHINPANIKIRQDFFECCIDREPNTVNSKLLYV